MALLHVDFHSELMRLNVAMNVILPQPTRVALEKHVAGGAKWPTLWLLHGCTQCYTDWQRYSSIERFADERGLAVVMPDAHRSWYTDAQAGPPYFSFLTEELPFLARAFFPLSDRREDNFIAGLSMGGYGAFKLAMLRPDMYAAAVSLSGCLDMVTFAESFAEEYLLREMETVFGGVEAIAGTEHDLLHVAEQLAAAEGPKPRLLQACGTADPHCESNRRFRDHARRLGLDLTHEEAPGDHDWDFWDPWLKYALQWMKP